MPASNERGCTTPAVRTTSRSQAAVLAMGSIRRLDDIREWARRKGRILNVDALSPDPSGATTARVVPRQREALTSRWPPVESAGQRWTLPGRHSRPIATRAGRRRAHRRRRARQTNQTNGATRSPPNGTSPVTSRAQATARTPKTTTPRRQNRAMSSVHSSTRMKPPSPQTSGGDCRAEHRQMTSCPQAAATGSDAVRSTPWCTRPATGRQHTPRWRRGKRSPPDRAVAYLTSAATHDSPHYRGHKCDPGSGLSVSSTSLLCVKSLVVEAFS